jgi:hypothetical protein
VRKIRGAGVEFSPALVWVLRDFSLDKDGLSDDEYLNVRHEEESNVE